ncbi:MAG: M81 family metallopeptidase, partial [Alphaproteobacteria bacterium]|nr:M81 family metallopeptidase [Alphaproteobacteria bacterium]
MTTASNDKTLRVAIAGFALESVSFLPGAHGIADFEKATFRGAAMIEALRGSQSPVGGFIDILEAEGVEIVPLTDAHLGAGGNASDEAFDFYRDEICAGLRDVRNDIDGVLLFLHGAMTTPTRTDPESEFMQAVREAVGTAMPVMVASDLHANVDAGFGQLADALFGYHYSPHTDMDETGRRAARCMVRTLRGETVPVMAIRKPNVMLPSIFTATSVPPLSDIVAEGFAWERDHDGIVDVSIFCGFAYADVPQVGFTVVVVTDGDQGLADRAADALAERIWDLRRDLLHEDKVCGLADGVARAVELSHMAQRPVVLLEHADRMNDSTHILAELMKHPGRRTMVPYLCDPTAAETAIAAGKGAEVTLPVGGWSSDRAGPPVEITGKVLYAGDKSYRGTGKMWNGVEIRLGPTALIEAGDLTISIVSRYVFAIDLDPFTQFGLDVMDFDIVLLRSKTHFRAVYEE